MSEARKTLSPDKVWTIVIGLLFLGGVVAAIMSIIHGLDVFGTSNVVFWTLPLATYVFFALASTGLTMVASIPLFLQGKKYDRIAKRAVYLALGSLAAAFLAMAVDLGSLGHMFNYLVSPNLSSPLWWIGVFYLLEGVLLLVKVWHIQAGKSAGKRVEVLALLSAIAACATLGLVFGSIEGRPAYLGAFAPVYFLITAFLSGLAVVVLFGRLSQNAGLGLQGEDAGAYEDLSAFMGHLVAAVLILFVWQTLIRMTATSAAVGNLNAVFGRLSFHVSLWLGLVAPLVILLSPRLRAMASSRIAAPALILVGLFADRVFFVIGGQTLPLGPLANGLPETVRFAATWTEWLVVGFSVGVMLLTYKLGERYLKLETSG